MPQTSFTEVLEWKTDVIRAKGAEQRFALRTRPRQVFNFTYVMDPPAFSKAKSFSRSQAEKEFLLPRWGDLSYLGAISSTTTILNFDTRFANYAEGAQVIVYDEYDHYEAATILTLTDTSITLVTGLTKDYTKAVVAPLQIATFINFFEADRQKAEFIKATASFQSLDSTDLAALWQEEYPFFRGHEVMMDRPIVTGDIREAYKSDISQVDDGVALIWRGTQRNYPTKEAQVAWHLLSREELWSLRLWLYTRRGKWRGFWLPSWNKDLELTQPISSTDTTITISDVGYSTHEEANSLMILTTGGLVYYLRVISGFAGSPGEEILALDGAAGINVTVSDIAMIAYLSFVRFNADRVEIQHRVAGGSSVIMPTLEIPEP